MNVLLLGAALAAAAAGGFVQGITGFGAGIVVMLVLPFALSVPEAAGVTGVASLALTMSMVLRYRHYAHLRAIALPAAGYITVSWASILIGRDADPAVMKGALGVFLIALAAYFLSGKGSGFEPKGTAAVACVLVSGVCDGLFGIGGPLMVVYYLARIKDVKEYLGTIQAFFMITLAAATVMRLASGVLSVADAPLGAASVIGMLAGASAASRLVGKLDGELVRKATYVVIGFAGVVSVAGALPL